MKISIKNELNEIKLLWNQFWFNSSNYYSLSLFRLLFFSGLFIFYSIRALDFQFLFSSHGFLTEKFYLDTVPETYLNFLSLEQFGFNDSLSPFLYGLFLLLILCAILGYGRRWLLIGIWILHIIFIRRFPIAIYGADMVVSCWLLYFILAPGNHYFTLFKKYDKQDRYPILTSVGCRLFQIQLCVIYAFSGLEKAKGLTWWQGDAVWYVMGNSQIVSMDFGFLAHFPSLVVLLSFSTILWEVYFPFAVWIPKLQKYVLFFGFSMHLFIGVLMNLGFFAWFMLSVYLLFIKSESLQKYIPRSFLMDRGAVAT